ncbi:hypothetical protein RIVM261_070160 [Rivularia sp. IAM M-261]|nr:hypothetical protein CAL7716_017970 [Calothrix sp. PCC 7716]GJD22060.1 hypothetical protein RIVM261_070160 [Rivularia sp. IAM M-261]
MILVTLHWSHRAYWYAGKYPEIAERCNDALTELIEKQALISPELATNVYDRYPGSHSF